tara:strand:- start:439 stop:1371 length:933 start_codon:yes stop_codon:yes gene_type:complete
MKNNLSNIKKSKYYLDKGDCIAIPTETVYGLAGNAYSNRATLKIFKLKKRTKKNPLIVHYNSVKMLNNDCILNNQFIKLYKKFCPGPITFVLKLKKNSKISKNVTNNKKTLAIRFPNHSLSRKLLKLLSYPLAAPSANISTKISPVSKSDVKDEFGNKIKYILDGGQSKIGLESTIISLVGRPKILRLGAIERAKINKVLNKNIKYVKTNKKISAPGQSKLHYSPGIPIKLNVTKSKHNEAFILINKRKKSYKNYFYLSKNKNLKQAAKNLYKILRIIKNRNYKSIVIEKIPNIGIGETINDRLKRASAK